MTDPANEKSRLEALWAGTFGDSYVDRNAEAHVGREPFWRERVEALGTTSALEVGCNVGGNLVWLATLLGEEHVAGVEINEQAVAVARERLPAADIRTGMATDLPFDDGAFDLVFTAGVLIHQSREALPTVMDEIVRVADRHVICAEYYAPELVEVPYRGHSGALFKDDYGQRYLERHPGLTLVDQGFLPASEGAWDDVTHWTLRKDG